VVLLMRGAVLSLDSAKKAVAAPSQRPCNLHLHIQVGSPHAFTGLDRWDRDQAIKESGKSIAGFTMTSRA
jgi:hypothetical protein